MEIANDDINSVVINNLSFSYDGKNNIFNDINIKVDSGKFVCLLGQSGCGKSTLLKLLSGLIKPTSGEIYLGNTLHKGPNLRKAVVFQDFGLFPWMSAIDNVVLGASQRYPEKSKQEIEEIAKQHLLSIGLSEKVFELLPGELSGGMQQRCGIARAFALDSPFLMMDEPFGALDAVTRAKLQDLILDLWNDSKPKKTIFFVTHDVDEALLLAEKVYVLGQAGNDIIYEIEINDEQKLHRYSEPSKESLQLRNDLVNQINKDVESKLTHNRSSVDKINE